MRIDILTLFPEIFASYFGESLLSKALAGGLVEIHTHDIRRWTTDKHHRVDDRPFGGGPGMVLMVEPIVAAYEAVAAMDPRPAQAVMLTPQGTVWNQRIVEKFVEIPRLILLCGRYEGFDQRIADILKPWEISLGDFVLNGGEVAAMAIVDSVIRLIPGVLGDEASSHTDSFSSGNRLLEGPQYTRPREFRGLTVPEVLLSGNHRAIEEWRLKESHERTQTRRLDLWHAENPRKSPE